MADPSVMRLPGTVVGCPIHGVPIKVFVDNPDDAIQSHHASGAFFEQDELDLIRDAVAPHAVIVDIGVNIGNHALFFDKYLAPREVVLVEVYPPALAILERVYLLNRCPSWNPRSLGQALSDRAGRVAQANQPVNNLGGLQFAPAEAGPYPCMTGDSVLAAHRNWPCWRRP